MLRFAKPENYRTHPPRASDIGCSLEHLRELDKHAATKLLARPTHYEVLETPLTLEGYRHDYSAHPALTRQ